MLGTDAPVRIDLVQLVQDTGLQLASTECIRVVLDQLMGKIVRAIDRKVIKGR